MKPATQQHQDSRIARATELIDSVDRLLANHFEMSKVGAAELQLRITTAQALMHLVEMTSA